MQQFSFIGMTFDNLHIFMSWPQCLAIFDSTNFRDSDAQPCNYHEYPHGGGDRFYASTSKRIANVDSRDSENCIRKDGTPATEREMHFFERATDSHSRRSKRPKP
jgi:hypothetical protein